MARDILQELGLPPPPQGEQPNIMQEPATQAAQGTPDIFQGNYPQHVTQPNVDMYGNPNAPQQPQQAQQQAPQQSQGSIFNDVVGGTIQAGSNLVNGAMQAIPEIYGAGKQVVTDPKRAAQNVAGGFASFGQGLMNAPGNARDWGVNRGILPEETPSMRLPEEYGPLRFPRENYNYPEGLGREGNEAGDALLEGAGRYAPNILWAGTSIPANMVAAAIEAVGQNENPITAALTMGATGLVTKYAASLPKKINQSFPERFGKEVSAKWEGVKKQAETRFGKEVFNSKGVPKESKWVPTDEHFDTLMKDGGVDIRASLDQYLTNQTPQNLNFLRAAVEKAERSIPKMSTINNESLTNLKETLKASHGIMNNEVESLLKQSGDPKILDRLNSANAWYEKKYVPLQPFAEDIAKFNKGNIEGQHLAQNMRTSQELQSAYKKELPGIQNVTSESPLKNFLSTLPTKTALGVVGTKLFADWFKNNFQNEASGNYGDH